MNSDLAEALRAIPGVIDAEIEDEEAGFDGVRVRLAAEADAGEVAAAVRRVLAGRGLRGRLAPPRSHVEPESPPPPPVRDPAAVLPGPGWAAAAATVPESSPPPQPEPERLAVPEPLPTATAPPAPPAVPAPVPAEAEARPGAGQSLLPLEPEPPLQPVAEPSRRLLTRLLVEEGRDVVTVTAYTDDGKAVMRRSRPSEEGMTQAIVAAVGALAEPSAPVPELVAAEHTRLGDRDLVTVVLDSADGRRLVGSAVVGADRPFAVARAVWIALTEGT